MAPKPVALGSPTPPTSIGADVWVVILGVGFGKSAAGLLGALAAAFAAGAGAGFAASLIGDRLKTKWYSVPAVSNPAPLNMATRTSRVLIHFVAVCVSPPRPPAASNRGPAARRPSPASRAS